MLRDLEMEHLIPATEYRAKVSATNPAGMRDGIAPAEITFLSTGQSSGFLTEKKRLVL